jgi:type II secretory pathway predicted ATPase ExeA
MLRQGPYTGSIRRRAVAAVVRAIREQEILLLLTGSAEAGKTVVLQAALAELATDSTRVISLDNPRSSDWSMCEIAGQIIGGPVDASVQDLLPAAIAALTAGERPLVVAVDDAHTLTGDALEFLLLLASPARSQLRPQLILAGRGEFWTGQPREELQLITRLAERVSLEPLTRAEVKDHVAFRLGEPDRAIEGIVSPAALAGIVDYSAGLPGRIDEILTASMQILACRGGRVLSADVVEAAAASMASAPGMPGAEADFIARRDAIDVAPPDAIPRPRTEAPAGGAAQAPRVAEPLASDPPRSIRPPFSGMPVEEFLPPAVLSRWTPSVPIPPNGPILPNKPASPNGLPSANEAGSEKAGAPGANVRDATPRSRHPVRAAAIAIGVLILFGLAWRIPEPGKRIAAVIGPWLGSPGNAAVETKAAIPAPVSATELTSSDAMPPAEQQAPIAASPVDHGGPQIVATGPDAKAQVAPGPPASGSGVSAEPDAGGAVAAPAASTLAAPEQHPDAPTPLAQAGAAAASRGPEPGLSLLRRGETLLGQGDVLAARLFFERAALEGNAAAALRAAKTYDPDFIATIDAPGLKADVSRAIQWYRQAFDASRDPEARERLAALSARAGPVAVNGSGR